MDFITFGGSGRVILLMFINALFYHTTPFQASSPEPSEECKKP